ncbi:MAG: histidine kinase [Oscillospiraceae bacterium]|nr:histidine kinase [Oscillospiraceae bacterium]
MSAAFVTGQQSVCFFALIVLIVSLFTNKSRKRSIEMTLCAAILILVAITLDLVNRSERDGAALFYMRQGVSAAMSVTAGAALAFSFCFWKPSKRPGTRWTALATALLPVWLAGLGWIFTREAALFPVAETLSLLIALSFYQRDEETLLKQRAEEIENRQAMLFQWQMRPHFLFNAMSAIRELLDSNPALASAGLDNLAGYLRKNLDALTLDHMIPFAQELEHIEQYVMLEKMNPANLFDVVYDLQIIDFQVPALSVQPLVENAIRHGVRALGDEGMVFVVTERHGDMIRIIVEDNGPGFSGNVTEQQKQRISHGLENVRKRLETQCGGSLHIRSGENGTRLIVLLPKKE